MMAQLVIAPPERGEGRHGQEQATAGLDEARPLDESGQVVLAVLEHIKGSHYIKLTVYSRQRIGLVGDAWMTAPVRIAGKAERHRARLENSELAKGRQNRDHTAGAGAYIEQARRARQVESRDHRACQIATGAKPPVLRIDPRKSLVLRKFQVSLLDRRGSSPGSTINNDIVLPEQTWGLQG